MNREKMIQEFVNAVEDMKCTKFNGTYYWLLNTDENDNDWAIVLGWADGYDAEEQDDCTDGTWRLCAKLAYQSNKSIMQCDYDVDWLMPYNAETGDVDDNEVSIYPNTDLADVVDWLLKCYSSYAVSETEN